MSESARSGNAHRQTIERPSGTPKSPHPFQDTTLSARQTANNDHALSCRLPTFPKPSTASGRLDLHTVSNGPGLGRSDKPSLDDPSQHLEASRHIFSSQCIRTGIRLLKPMQTGFSLLGYLFVRHPPKSGELSGIEPLTPCLQSRCSPSGATAPIKGVIRCRSTASGGLNLKPTAGHTTLLTKTWWARVDSNYRPHAYQACALTN